MESWLEGVAYGAVANLNDPMPVNSSCSQSLEIDPTAFSWSVALDGESEDGEEEPEV
jgi:hypothetical protein